jgi:hypothetical protein
MRSGTTSTYAGVRAGPSPFRVSGANQGQDPSIEGNCRLPARRLRYGSAISFGWSDDRRSGAVADASEAAATTRFLPSSFAR